ncbi:MAG: pilus assembly protein PilM [Actinobacteria bacterium]|nr:pilus assembly protein PilM [Actinomycetota bacterium]MCB9412571.1 pilus assembly protein PilM [Actinomycetota bacterium]
MIKSGSLDVDTCWQDKEVAVAKTAIGLDINTSSVRAAQVRYDKGSTSVVALAESTLFPGVVTAAGVADPAALAAALSALWNTFGIKGKRVILGVGGQRVVVRPASIPVMPGKEIKEALPLYVSESVPFDVNESELDFVVSGIDLDGDGNQVYEGILTGAPTAYLTELVEAVQQANLTVVAIDVASFALIRAVVPPVPPGYLVSEAVVNVDEHASQVVVHVNGRPMLVRDLPLGADVLAGGSIEPLVEEISTTVGFYQSGEKATPLQRILLEGAGSQLRGLDLAVSRSTNLPVAHDAAWLALPRDAAKASDEAVRAVGTHMTVAVGLAMGAAL